MTTKSQDTPVPPFVVLLENCKINYLGRAKASSEGGEFLIIVKKDGTILLHSLLKGMRPIYYNPSGELSISFKKDNLFLESIAKNKEELKVEGQIKQLMDIEEETKAKKRSFEARIGTEKWMVQELKKKPSIIDLKKKDFDGAEVRISSGRIDLLFKDLVIEVKKRAGARTYDQLSRYMRGSDKSRGIIVCIKATKTLKNAVGESSNIRLIEKPEWAEFDAEFSKENY